MHIQDILDTAETTFSFEFFPPKDQAGAEDLFQEIAALEALKPSFVSVTYGAGGSTRAMTHEICARIREQTSLVPTPHLTCVKHTEDEVASILKRFADAGMSNVLALRGDPPGDDPRYNRAKDHFRYASELVSFIRRFGERGGHADPRGFGIGVAGFPEGHPETPNRLVEMDMLKAKVDAGADLIITQLFFDNHDFYDFRERCELAGVHVPIIAGLMPITSERTIKRMADLALGAHFPARLLKSIARCNGDAQGVRRVGLHWATEQCRDLLDNRVRGVHFYTLNRSTATREIYANLGVKDSSGLTG